MLKRSKTIYSLRPDDVKLWVENTRQIPIPDATYDAVFDNRFNIHFKGVYFLTQKAIPIMKDNGGVRRYFSVRLPYPDRLSSMHILSKLKRSDCRLKRCNIDKQ